MTQRNQVNLKLFRVSCASSSSRMISAVLLDPAGGALIVRPNRHQSELLDFLSSRIFCCQGNQPVKPWSQQRPQSGQTALALREETCLAAGAGPGLARRRASQGPCLRLRGG